MKLTYTNNIRYENEKYSIAIPDGFQLHPGMSGRDFEAWAENVDENVDSPITFYAGAENKIDMENEKIFAPSLCSAFAEMLYWQNPLSQKMYAKSKFIPLNDKIPAGGISAGYDPDSFSYNISVFMKGCLNRCGCSFWT